MLQPGYVGEDKNPESEAEMDVRDKLSHRYDLCDWAYVYTTLLLTAEEPDDMECWM